MKKEGILFLLLVLTSSCTFFTNKKVILYEYNDVIITRINDYPFDYFYYGKYNLKNLPKTHIYSSFSGFNSGMGAYIVFKENKEVEIIRVYGTFKKIGSDSLLILNDQMYNAEFLNSKNKAGSKKQNTIYVSDILKTEKNINLHDSSKVKAKYIN